MYNEMNTVLTALEKVIGPLSLLMTLGSEENSDPKLTLVVSAAGLDYAGNQDAVKLVIECLKKNVSPEVQNTIVRVNVKSTNDPLVQAITGAFNLAGGSLHIQSNTFNGIYVADAKIYKAARFSRARP